MTRSLHNAPNSILFQSISALENESISPASWYPQNMKHINWWLGKMPCSEWQWATATRKLFPVVSDLVIPCPQPVPTRDDPKRRAAVFLPPTWGHQLQIGSPICAAMWGILQIPRGFIMTKVPWLRVQYLNGSLTYYQTCPNHLCGEVWLGGFRHHFAPNQEFFRSLSTHSKKSNSG